MSNLKIATSSIGKPMHFSVGAIIKKDNKYLLIDRSVMPLGFASLAGHVDEGESPLQAIRREVKEESNLDVIHTKLLIEEEVHDNKCSKGVNAHYWYVFSCEVKGILRHNSESKSIGWYTLEQIKKLKLEPVWQHWFKKLKLI